MSALYTIRAEGGPHAGQVFPVNGTATLGREAGNAIALSDNQLSRRHARFDANPGGLTITDLGSANGVYVNGQRINGFAALRPGDAVGVGGSTFRVELAGGGPAHTFAPPSFAPPAAQGFAPGVQPYLAPPAPLSPPPAQRRSLPLPLLVAAGLLLLVLCAGTGAAVAALALRGGDDPAPTAAAAGGSAVPGAGGTGASTAPVASVASSTKRQTGVIAGRITNVAGQPIGIPGAILKVQIIGNSSVGQQVLHNPAVDSQGRYTQRVADGLYAISATVSVPYGNGVFELDLAPNDNQPDLRTYDSREGIVKDFTWKLTGFKPERNNPSDYASYYGQALQLQADSLKVPADSVVEITFTPRGTLIDGSTGQAIKRTVKGSNLAVWSYLNDIPIAAYTVSATVAANGQSRPLKVCVSDGFTFCSDPTKYVAQAQFDFAPGGAVGRAVPISLVLAE